jgi:hypothetical protein
MTRPARPSPSVISPISALDPDQRPSTPPNRDSEIAVAFSALISAFSAPLW